MKSIKRVFIQDCVCTWNSTSQASQTEALLELCVSSSEQLRSVSVMEFRVRDLNIDVAMGLVKNDVSLLVRVWGGVSQGDVIHADVITRTDTERILQKQLDIRPR